MKLRASSCHAGLASPSVNGTPLASATRAFNAPGPASRSLESHADARAASAQNSVILSIGFIGHLLMDDCSLGLVDLGVLVLGAACRQQVAPGVAQRATGTVGVERRELIVHCTPVR